MFILTSSCAVFPKNKTDLSKILWIFIFSFSALQYFSYLM